MSTIKTLSSQLSMLGYNRFEISRMIDKAARGKQLNSLSQRQLSYVVGQLEKYVTLGTQYVAAYSK